MGDDGPALNFRNALPLNEHLSVEFDGMLQLHQIQQIQKIALW